MDIKRDIKDICETLRDEELYTEAMAIEEITKAQDARIQKLEEALEKEKAWKSWWRQKAIANRNHKEFTLEPPGY